MRGAPPPSGPPPAAGARVRVSLPAAEGAIAMAHVVCEPCVNCKYTDCVTVCPMDCFYEGQNMLVIHPDECIDCGACVPVCPTEAIFQEYDVPAKWAEFVPLNARLAREGGWPN